jgi:hypothetical protein
MNNSFTALPGGVMLADNFIRNIEVFTSIFLNGSLLGFFFFVVVSILGQAYPLTPLNITLINYFSVGLPGLLISYWAIRSRGETPPASTEQFLKRILPFPLFASLVEACGLALVFLLSPNYLHDAQSNTIVLIGFILLSFLFFTFAPRMYSKTLGQGERLQLFLLGVFEVGLCSVVFTSHPLMRFFDLTAELPSAMSIIITVVVVCVFAAPLLFVRTILFKRRMLGSSR